MEEVKKGMGPRGALLVGRQRMTPIAGLPRAAQGTAAKPPSNRSSNRRREEHEHEQGRVQRADDDGSRARALPKGML
jgi:hypothetical protein